MCITILACNFMFYYHSDNIDNQCVNIYVNSEKHRQRGVVKNFHRIDSWFERSSLKKEYHIKYLTYYLYHVYTSLVIFVELKKGRNCYILCHVPKQSVLSPKMLMIYDNHPTWWDVWPVSFSQWLLGLFVTVPI